MIGEPPLRLLPAGAEDDARDLGAHLAAFLRRDVRADLRSADHARSKVG